MGVYDEVFIYCAGCGWQFSEQIKTEASHGGRYTISSMPDDIAIELTKRTIFCRHCGVENFFSSGVKVTTCRPNEPEVELHNKEKQMSQEQVQTVSKNQAIAEKIVGLGSAILNVKLGEDQTLQVVTKVVPHLLQAIIYELDLKDAEYGPKPAPKQQTLDAVAKAKALKDLKNKKVVPLKKKSKR